MKKILQIVPRAPGSQEGVGDYAETLARRLAQEHGLVTTFVAAAPSASEQTPAGFEILSPLTGQFRRLQSQENDAIILHYVNYGYDPRGLPRTLLQILRSLQGPAPAKIVTIFHELYASGSWRQSAFWLRPLQKRIAGSIARLSKVAIVSSGVTERQLAHLTNENRIIVHPVPSNFGEPALSPAEISEREPHCWVICGGTELIERSIRSFPAAARLVPAQFRPRELFVLGGLAKESIRQELEALKDLPAHYHPGVDAAAASRILSSCAFGWVDYFVQPDVPTSAILKSTAFAACCAHGIIPVFPRGGSPIALGEKALPGPFFVRRSSQHFPEEAERARAAERIYQWYQDHASSGHLAATVAETILS